MESDEQLRRETGQEPDNIDGRLVTCRLDELHSHPSYVRNDLMVSASQLSALVDLGDLAFRDPIVITRDRFIVDGYGQLALARQQGRLTIRCVEYDLTEQEALQYLLQKHRRSDGWNAFTRISLALDLEPGLKRKARSNQRAGGQNKGLSNLTAAEQRDIRAEIAAAAGVSVGNVAKVKQLNDQCASGTPAGLTLWRNQHSPCMAIQQRKTGKTARGFGIASRHEGNKEVRTHSNFAAPGEKITRHTGFELF